LNEMCNIILAMPEGGEKTGLMNLIRPFGVTPGGGAISPARSMWDRMPDWIMKAPAVEGPFDTNGFSGPNVREKKAGRWD